MCSFCWGEFCVFYFYFYYFAVTLLLLASTVYFTFVFYFLFLRCYLGKAFRAGIRGSKEKDDFLLIPGFPP